MSFSSRTNVSSHARLRTTGDVAGAQIKPGIGGTWRVCFTKSLSLIIATVFMLASSANVRPYTLQYASQTAGAPQVRWATTTINIALSTSLQSPQANIKAGSDSIGAARRALEHWEEAAGVQFVETVVGNQAISSANQPDGVSLITIANTSENSAAFSGRDAPGFTRIFFNSQTGAISEADLVINPNQLFSTDGTTGTFDLESVLTHEIGHMLGLEHSAVIGATMQPRLARNGVYTLPARTMSTLSSDDRLGVRSIYNPTSTSGATGSISGTLTFANASAVFGAHVFAIEASTGRVAAGNISLPNGAYRIDGLAAGSYRVVAEPLDEPVAASEIATQRGAYFALLNQQPPFRTIELATQVNVAAGQTANITQQLASLQPFLNPRFVGINNQISSVPLPLTPGFIYNVQIGGELLNQVPSGNVTTNSPFLQIDPASVRQQLGASFPVLSFNVAVSADAPPGDYSVRVQATNGEIAYVTGALTVDIFNNITVANPIDDTRFFVRQHYLDFLNREPEADGWAAWIRVLTNCAANDTRCDRIEVSSSFFRSPEFQTRGYFAYRFYAVALGRLPRYAEFLQDVPRLSSTTLAQLEQRKVDFSNEFVTRPEFRQTFDSLSNRDYVERLLQTAGVQLSSKESLIAALDAGTKTRAQVLREIVESNEVYATQFNPAFVAMQYFGYLRRDPEQPGYNNWLRVINANPNDYRIMVNGFVNSTEYRARFGQP